MKHAQIVDELVHCLNSLWINSFMSFVRIVGFVVENGLFQFVNVGLHWLGRRDFLKLFRYDASCVLVEKTFEPVASGKQANADKRGHLIKFAHCFRLEKMLNLDKIKWIFLILSFLLKKMSDSNGVTSSRWTLCSCCTSALTGLKFIFEPSK